MTELNGGTKGHVLTGRQLTLTLDRQTHMFLNDIAKYHGASIHEVATRILAQGITLGHIELRQMKFVWLLANWLTWGNGPPVHVAR